MTKRKAASLSGSLFARKGEATTVGLAHSPLDALRLSSIAIEPTADPGTCFPEPPEVGGDGNAGAFGAGRERPVRDDDWAAFSASSGRGLLRPRLLVPLASLLIAVAGYFSVAWYTDGPRSGTGATNAPARVQEAFVPESVPLDTDAGFTGSILSASKDLPADGGSIETAVVPSSGDEPVAVPEAPPDALAAAIDASALAGKTPPSLAASAVGATAAGQGYLVQLYALRSDAAVRREWRRLKTLHADLFAGMHLTVERVELESPNKSLFRMLAGRIETAAVARKLCLRARQRKLDCIVVRP